MYDIDSGICEGGIGGEDDVLTFRERFLRERIECAAPHDDGMAGGEVFEMTKVVG